MPLPFQLPDLERALSDLMAQIPPGHVVTCGMLAKALGSHYASRWVGSFALHHLHDDGCNCHRVIRARGELGGYVTGNPDEKIRRLKQEGVPMPGGTIDLSRFGFHDFSTDYPLLELRNIQEKLAQSISIQPRKRLPKLLGGVDVAYPTPQEAQAAYALVETDTGKLVYTHVIRRPVRFPFITTFLSFRELPILLELINEVRAAGKMAEVLLVDGSGILHPSRAGAASHLGVTADVPTVGVIKKLLCGQVDIDAMRPLETRPIQLKDELVGIAVRPTSRSLRPLFISPGHRCDLTFAEQAVRQTLLGHRLPEPIYWADVLSKKKEHMQERSLFDE